MKDVAVQQALFHRHDGQPARLQARSAGFDDAWLPDAERLIAGFGDRPMGVACPSAVFAQPLTQGQVAIVCVTDQPDVEGRFLAFHILVLGRQRYEQSAGDPFLLARQLPAAWSAHGELPALAWSVEQSPRTVADVQQVLRRVKASALRENEDPESPDFERTAENSESPALLGGVQVLVDGGKLVFVRPHGDLALVEGLWTLLPYTTRCKTWPASFAFSNELGFDVVVLPQLNDADIEGYTTEDQATQYPAGSYELALQTAAESGDQRELETVFRRRNSNEILRLALWLVAGMSLVLIASRWFIPGTPALTEQH
jgi:hypothetical protein